MAEQQTQAEEAKHAPMDLHVDHRLRLKARIVSAALTALALLLPLCVIMMITGVFVATYRDVLQEVGIVEALTDAGGNTSRDHMQWMRLFDENAQTTSDLMAEALKELDTPEGYVGPRVFTDGIVIELRDGEPYYPSDYPEDALRLTREEFESVRSGSTFLHKEWFAQLVQADSKSTPNEEDANAAYVTVGEIGDNVFYVGYTPYYEYALLSGIFCKHHFNNGHKGGQFEISAWHDMSKDILDQFQADHIERFVIVEARNQFRDFLSSRIIRVRWVIISSAGQYVYMSVIQYGVTGRFQTLRVVYLRPFAFSDLRDNRVVRGVDV